MHRLLSIVVVSAILAASSACGEEPSRKPIADTAVVTPQPLPVSRAKSIVPALESTEEPRDGSPRELTPLENLRRAADSLEQAGYRDQARRITEEADSLDTMMSEELNNLTRQVVETQKKIAALRNLVGTETVIQFEFLTLHVSPQTARQLKLERPQTATQPDGDGLGAMFTVRPYKDIHGDINRLLASGDATVFAKSRIITIPGEWAALTVCKPFAAPVGDTGAVMDGLCYQILPQLLADRRIRFDFKLEVNRRDFESDDIAARRLNTQIEMRANDTLITILAPIQNSNLEGNRPELADSVTSEAGLRPVTWQNEADSDHTIPIILITPTLMGR